MGKAHLTTVVLHIAISTMQVILLSKYLKGSNQADISNVDNTKSVPSHLAHGYLRLAITLVKANHSERNEAADFYIIPTQLPNSYLMTHAYGFWMRSGAHCLPRSELFSMLQIPGVFK